MVQQPHRRGPSLGCGIFLSHSSVDAQFATDIALRLAEWGFQSIFLDFDPERGIPAGRDWENEIYRQIRISGAVVALCSRNSMASKWCFAELTQARAMGKEVFPIRIDDFPIEPQLRDRQVIDLYADESTAYERLHRGLRDAGLDPKDDFAWNRTREPYPGLNVFTEEDAGVYFGRQDTVADVLDRLKQMATNGEPRLALVIGASGSGKSSLVRAGILPRLEKSGRNWCAIPPIRPQLIPIEALAQSLA